MYRFIDFWSWIQSEQQDKRKQCQCWRVIKKIYISPAILVNHYRRRKINTFVIYNFFSVWSPIDSSVNQFISVSMITFALYVRSETFVLIPWSAYIVMGICSGVDEYVATHRVKWRRNCEVCVSAMKSSKNLSHVFGWLTQTRRFQMNIYHEYQWTSLSGISSPSGWWWHH